jgi:hypothetical protein
VSLDWPTCVLVVNALALALALTLVFRWGVRPVLVWSVAVVLVTVFVAYAFLCFPAANFSFDYKIFRQVGCDVWAGLDPYEAERLDHHLFLNPPSALPLFALFAAVPAGAGCAAWTIFNVLACLGLVTLAQRALVAEEQASGQLPHGAAAPWQLSPTVLAGLTAVLAVSDASFTSLSTGQLSLFTAVALLAALLCRGRGWPVGAGVFLALATVKIGTMLPFLLLFCQKSSIRAWVALGVVVIGLCLAATAPAELPRRAAEMLARIEERQAPGQINDYSFDGPINETILGFEHAFYRLGLRDRSLIRGAQFGALLLLGAWVARKVLAAPAFPRAAACSLVALYSSLFLYHRRYDSVILALPLVYAVGRARSSSGPARWLFAAAALAIVAVWYLKEAPLQAVYQFSLTSGVWGRLAQAAVLPYGTWLILLAMVCLDAAWGVATATPQAAKDLVGVGNS